MDDVLIDAPLEITPDMVTTDCFHYHYLVIRALDLQIHELSSYLLLKVISFG
jgi:hypothetical protein